MTLTLPAPAKLNLFLHITGQQADGYHTLQTIFQLLDYGDSIALRARQDGAIRLQGNIEGLAPEQNLIVRAAKLLQSSTRCKLGADICCDKRLPHGGGLGGGSSNAATTLAGLNQLWGTRLSDAELASMGLQLGADVPVFIRGLSAWGEGVGESLRPVKLPHSWYLIIDPGVTVSTAHIFSDKYLTRNTQPITLAAFLKHGGHNDCEPVARRLFPLVDEAMAWLSQYTRASLTGTGGCIFAAFSAHSDAEQIASQAPARWRCIVARGVDESPLRRALCESQQSVTGA